MDDSESLRGAAMAHEFFLFVKHALYGCIDRICK